MAEPASLAWYVNRLRLMSPAEIAFRARRSVGLKLNRRGLGMAHTVPPADTRRFGRPGLQLPSALGDAPALRAAADRILAGRWDVFALKGVELGFPPQWNRDPLTGKVSPLTFGKTIDYRDERVVGNSKYLWEPARHLEMAILAQAWQVFRESRYLQAVRRLLDSWLDDAPYPNGPHWTSSLELAIRLLNWSVSWHLVGGAESPLFSGPEGAAFQQRWLQAVFRHAQFIAGHLSHHSSANNHLLGEYMGLFVAGTTWPCWAESQRWHQAGKAGFITESLKQNFPDGVNREQAVYYQHEVMDMMLLCLRLGQANGDSFPAAYLERLERLAEFIASVMDVGGQVPMIGDADDAKMVRLSHEPGWCHYRSLLASCALLFDRADFARKAGGLDDKTRWLFGDEAAVRWPGLAATGRPAPAPRLAFPEGGYYLLGAALDTPEEVRVVVDAAPLGYLSIAAHGHADALAFTLSSHGEELLIDPGTYAYHTLKTWRDYFKGTSAHNTVRVDGQDQSENGGNFMWLRKANSRMTEHRPEGGLQVFEGEHDGYRRLADAVTHRRRVEFDVAARRLRVTDTLQCQGRHEVELHWHFAPGLQLSHEAGQLRVLGQRNVLRMHCTAPQFVLSLHQGEESPILGWVSHRFDEKLPSPTARWAGQIQGRTEWTTVIELLPALAGG